MSVIAALLIITGYFLVIRKLALGFIVQGIGCLIMIFLNIEIGVTFVNSIFLIINGYGWIKWRYEV